MRTIAIIVVICLIIAVLYQLFSAWNAGNRLSEDGMLVPGRINEVKQASSYRRDIYYTYSYQGVTYQNDDLIQISARLSVQLPNTQVPVLVSKSKPSVS